MTLENIQALTRYFATGSSTSTDYSDTDINRQINSNYNQLTILAFSASKEWQYRGDNKQTTSITAATRSYTLPTTFLRINRIEIKYPSASDYTRAEAIDYKNVLIGLDDYTTSRPQFDLKDDKIEIFVSAKTASIAAVTSGLLIYYDNEITELSGASDAPDIPEPFSRLLALLSAKDYCGVNGLNSRLNWIMAEIQKEEFRFVEFISTRNEAKRLQLKTKSEDYSVGGDYGNPSVNWS